MATSKASRPQVAVFLENPKDVEIVREALKALQIKNSIFTKGGIKEAFEVFSKKKSPPYLIIDVSKSEMPVSDLNHLFDLCEPGIKVLAIGTKNEVGLYRDLIKLGVFDYLVSPLLSDILGRSLKDFILGGQTFKKSEAKSGKIIAFVGARGGVGSTLIATNFAAYLSKEKARHTVLIDLDLHFGTVPLYFDLKSNQGLRDALETPSRMDSLFIDRLLTPVNDRLSIISSDEALDEPIKYETNSIDTLVQDLSKHHHYVIIDIPHCANDICLAVISMAHIMVLVADASLAALRDSRRLMRLFGAEEGGRKIALVLNKVGAYEKGEINVSDFEETLNHKINHVFSFDRRNPMESINQGKLLIEEESPLGNSIKELANEIIGEIKPKDKESWFSTLFKKEN